MMTATKRGSHLGKRSSGDFEAITSHGTQEREEEEEDVNVVDLSDSEQEARATTPAYIQPAPSCLDHHHWLAQQSLALLHSASFPSPHLLIPVTTGATWMMEPPLERDPKRPRVTEASDHAAPLDLSTKSDKPSTPPQLPRKTSSKIPVTKAASNPVPSSSQPPPPKAELQESDVLPRVPDVCEHFRKSLASFTTPPSFDVDEHFKRALGDDWKSKLTPKPS